MFRQDAIRVLSIEAPISDSDQTLAQLKFLGNPLYYERVTTKDELLEALGRTWDLIVTETRFMSHDELQRLLRERSLSFPVMVLGQKPVGPIMLVDDDEDLREMIALALKQRGHEVTSFADAREALTYLDAGHRPRAILTDYQMQGMEGGEFLGHLARKNLSSSVIIVSSAPAEVEEQVPRERYTSLITKPVNLATFPETVKAKLA